MIIKNKFNIIFRSLFILLLLSISTHHAVYANSAKNKMMDDMKIEFDQALNSGDASTLKRIWKSIDSKFTDKFDKLSARAIIYAGGPALNSDRYLKLYKNNPDKFEKVALFMSSINTNFMDGENSKLTGSFSGKVKNLKKQNVSGAKVIIAGKETLTDSNGKFILSDIPEGIYDVYILSPGYKLTLDPITRIQSNKKPNFIYRLEEVNYSPPKISPQQANSKMNEAMTQIAQALRSDKPKGTEILRGKLVDADSGAPISGAKVIMACQSTLKTTTSDKNGYFSIEEIPTELCDFTVAYTNAKNIEDLYQKSQTGTVIGYAFSARYKIVLKANHLHENTWRIKPRHMKADDKP